MSFLIVSLLCGRERGKAEDKEKSIFVCMSAPEKECPSRSDPRPQGIPGHYAWDTHPRLSALGFPDLDP